MLHGHARTDRVSVIVLSAFLGLLPLAAKPGSHDGKTGNGQEASGRGGPKGNHGSLAGMGTRSPESQLARKTNLASRLQGLLPPETDLLLAAAGFRNLGQFVAAVHVSHNLGIPFDQLKTELVDAGKSLGSAIQTLKPGVDADETAEDAENEAQDDLQESGS